MRSRKPDPWRIIEIAVLGAIVVYVTIMLGKFGLFIP